MNPIKKKITIFDQNIHLNIPSKCQFCNAILPQNSEVLAEGYTSDSLGRFSEHGKYFLLLKCPFCESIITDLFSILPENPLIKKFRSYAPLKKQSVKISNEMFPSQIQNISPRFISIYNQSLKAEKNGLNELTGMGYRKALEFLVKDYAIYLYPTEEVKIQKMSLQNALAKLDTQSIKILGQVSIKIGNDETHYYKKHDWDIADMKSYISTICTFILSDLNFREATDRLKQDHQLKD
ncbi:hypothetical protein [Lapidilactobacillus bayanensis]|uniref:hypothetical protein n=1 Tax=Lapidilactobacillus bayanensis TaxID=2485998 RepID=UPI000F790841|nr:hypothetical protein [Lapidilactobacillus bayanensis]